MWVTNELIMHHFREQDDRIVTRDHPLYYGQKHTSVAVPAFVIPREPLSYINVKPSNEYENVRSSNRKTNPYLPTSVRFQNVDPIRELLLYKQGDVESTIEREKQKSRSQRARCEEDDISHVVGYFNVSHKGIVPKNQGDKAK